MSRTPKNRLVLILALLCLADLVIPVPILGLTLLWVVLERPAWFRRLVDDVYAGAGPGAGGPDASA